MPLPKPQLLPSFAAGQPATARREADQISASYPSVLRAKLTLVQTSLYRPIVRPGRALGSHSTPWANGAAPAHAKRSPADVRRSGRPPVFSPRDAILPKAILYETQLDAESAAAQETPPRPRIGSIRTPFRLRKRRLGGDTRRCPPHTSP